MCVSCHYSLRSVYCHICSCVTHCNALTSASSTGPAQTGPNQTAHHVPAVVVSKSYSIFVTYILLATLHMYSHFTNMYFCFQVCSHVCSHVQTGSNQTAPHSNEFPARPAAPVVMSASSQQPMSTSKTLNRLLPNRRSDTFRMH